MEREERVGAEALIASATPALQVRSMSCGYDGRAVIENVSFSVASGDALVLLGPNGVGKTTLFRTILGFLPALGGEVLLDGERVGCGSRKQIARKIAYVPQTHENAFGFTVREMVLMGRTPLLEGLSSPDREDERRVDGILEDLGLMQLAERDCISLSGGELQMVLIARALAQDPRILVMDEPCANLDLGNQVIVLERIRSLMARDIAVVVTSHDPNHALQLGSDVICLGRSGSVRVGSGGELLDSASLSELYGTAVGVGCVSDPQGRIGPACAAIIGAGMRPDAPRDAKGDEAGSSRLRAQDGTNGSGAE